MNDFTLSKSLWLRKIIVLELKKLGIEVNHPPTKLKAGCGDAVVAVLLDLVRKTV